MTALLEFAKQNLKGSESVCVCVGGGGGEMLWSDETKIEAEDDSQMLPIWSEATGENQPWKNDIKCSDPSVSSLEGRHQEFLKLELLLQCFFLNFLFQVLIHTNIYKSVSSWVVECGLPPIFSEATAKPTDKPIRHILIGWGGEIQRRVSSSVQRAPPPWLGAWWLRSRDDGIPLNPLAKDMVEDAISSPSYPVEAGSSSSEIGSTLPHSSQGLSVQSVLVSSSCVIDWFTWQNDKGEEGFI